MTNKWDVRFLQLAEMVASWSKDPSTKTGAVIVRPDKSVLSLGFNGFPKNMLDTPELYANRETKYSRIVHCEMNALIHAKASVEGCTLYTWAFPSCDRCAVHMLQSGITRFVFPALSEELVSRWGESVAKTKSYLTEAGVEWLEIPREDLLKELEHASK
jgi:dCMP deaminase